MKKIKIALIGNVHDHALANFGVLKSHPEVFDVVGVCNLVPGKDESSYANEKTFTMQQLLDMDELDAVLIESGKENEVYDAQKFAAAGKALFIDKPGSSNCDEYDKLLDIVQNKQLPFALGYVYRFNPMVQKVLEMQKNGELGTVYSVEAQMSVRHDMQKRRWLMRYKGGMTFFLGCHLIDVACTFLGFPSKVLPLGFSSGHDGLTGCDVGGALLMYDHAQAYLRTSAIEVNGYGRRQIVINGTAGTVEIQPVEYHIKNVKCEDNVLAVAKITLQKDNPPQWDEGGKTQESQPFARYTPMLMQFAAQIRGEEGYVRPLEYERKLMRTIVAACGADNEVFIPENV